MTQNDVRERMSDAEATVKHDIFSTVIDFAGCRMTPEYVEELRDKLIANIESGSCAWAYAEWTQELAAIGQPEMPTVPNEVRETIVYAVRKYVDDIILSGSDMAFEARENEYQDVVAWLDSLPKEAHDD